jgi:acyl-coenzyme A synthetase/AMP-(fatty) acid ligase
MREGSAATTETIQAYVRERLAPHKVPREVRFVTALPRTGSGKIDRAGLRTGIPVAPAAGRGGTQR